MSVGVAKWACRLHHAAHANRAREMEEGGVRERGICQILASFAGVGCKSACLDFYIIKLRQLVHGKRLPIDSLPLSLCPFLRHFLHHLPYPSPALYYHFRLAPVQKHSLPWFSWPSVRFNSVQFSSALLGSYMFAFGPRTLLRILPDNFGAKSF